MASRLGPDPPARDDVERRRWLGDLLAVAAGELLAHGLPHEPAARDHIERLGDGLAELGQPAAAAAAAGRRAGHDHPLARQMLRQRLPGGLVPDMRRRRSCRRRRGLLGRQLVLGRGVLELGELQLELLESRAALEVWPNCSRRALASSSFRCSISSLAPDRPRRLRAGSSASASGRRARPGSSRAPRRDRREGIVGSFLTRWMQAHPPQFLKSKDESTRTDQPAAPVARSAVASANQSLPADSRAGRPRSSPHHRPATAR